MVRKKIIQSEAKRKFTKIKSRPAKDNFIKNMIKEIVICL